MEAFITEYNMEDSNVNADGVDSNPEMEVAEILATAWKEKRAELSKLQRSRPFTEAKEAKRSFRIKVEELKKRTKCNRCGRTGHWARECRQPRYPTSSNPAAAKSAGFKGKERGASYVAKAFESLPGTEINRLETVPAELSELRFVAAVCNEPTMIQRLQAYESERCHAFSQEVFLVLSPAVEPWTVDAAAPSIGAPALDKFKDIWTKMDIPSCAKARSQCLIQVWQWGLRGVGSEFGAAGWDWRLSWNNQCSSGSGGFTFADLPTCHENDAGHSVLWT